MKPNTVLKILNGLKPAAYAFTGDFEAQGLIAYDSNNQIKLLDLFSEHDKEPLIFQNNKKEKIVNIISQSFGYEDNSFLLTTTTETPPNVFTTYLCDFKKGSKKELFKSTSTPMIVAHPTTLKPLILFSSENDLNTCEINNGGSELLKIQSFKGRVPTGIHTSSFIDLTGDMHADLVLHTKDNDFNYIDIYKLVSEGELEEVESVKLPGTVGPILFSEISNPLAPDMVYVSDESGIFYLNLWKNSSMDHFLSNFPNKLNDFREKISKNSVDTIFKQKIIKLELNNILDSYKPVLMNRDNMPSGIFLADLSGSGVKDIFLTVENKQAGMQKVVAFNWDSSKAELTMHDKCNLDLNTSFNYIHSVSVCDYNNSGSQNLIITGKDTNPDGDDYISVPYEFEGIAQEPGVSFLTLVALANKKTFYVPGTVITMLYENEEKFCKTSLSPQTSFQSLQPLKVFIGLGPTNLFIDWATIKAPSDDNMINRKDAVSFLVPNTFSVFTLHDKNWRVQSFFSKLYFNITVYALLAVVIIFMTCFIILSIQEKRKYKRVMSKDSTRMIFNAL